MRSKPTPSRCDSLRQGAVSLAGITFLQMSSAAATDDTHGVQKKSVNYIDTHVHIWTNDFQKYPLAAGFTQRGMELSTFLPTDILHHARPSGVNRVVLVQMTYYGFDNSYMLDTIRQQPQVFKGIAVIDWKVSHPDRTMRELAKEGVRGFRIYPGSDSPSSWLDQAGFDKMFRCGADENLGMYPLIDPDALPAVRRQCRKYPRTPIVIDHLADIGMIEKMQEADIKALCSLAEFPQVKVKLSGFYALGEKKPPHLDIVPLIKRVYEAFGPQRLMWGSDCPFQVADETYEDSISLIRDRLDFVSAEDKEWMLCRSAEECFFP